MSAIYDTGVVLVLAIHLAWILWVIFGAISTADRRWLTVFHVASLLWGIVVEVGPWPCPLTISEQLLQTRAGMGPYGGSFLLHYLGLIVYPDIPVPLLTACAVAVCAVNLAVYSRRFWRQRHAESGRKTLVLASRRKDLHNM